MSITLQVPKGANAADVTASTRAILAAVPLCSVTSATPAGDPWIASMYFSFDDLDRLFVLTAPSTVHARGWEERPAVAATVLDTSQPFQGVKAGLQIAATAHRLEGEDAAVAYASYAARFPTMRDWLPSMEAIAGIESRFYGLTVAKVKVFDEARLGAEVWIDAELV